MSKPGKRVRVGITVGDINGIGPEVIIKSLIDNHVLSGIVPIIYGSSRLFSFYAKQLNLNNFHFNSINKADNADKKKINVLDVWQEEARVEFGKVTESGGKHAYESLKAAVEDLAGNKFDVLVTAPINKKNIQSDEFKFPGHTEYLANYANEENPLMIMVHEGLRVGVVTGHIPVKDVAGYISEEVILTKLGVFAKSLVQDFNIRKPKFAVLGLNPHSGDDGLIGDEEKNIIAPALEKAKNNGILAFGPYSADGFFATDTYKQFDGILAMYHDQGLTPFKTISRGAGVNYTAGLPIVRTSPDHGTAYDIAGKNIADESSFRNAIFAGCDIYRTRLEYRGLRATKLEPQQPGK